MAAERDNPFAPPEGAPDPAAPTLDLAYPARRGTWADVGRSFARSLLPTLIAAPLLAASALAPELRASSAIAAVACLALLPFQWALLLVRASARLLALALAGHPVLEIAVGSGRPVVWTSIRGTRIALQEDVRPTVRMVGGPTRSLGAARIQHAAGLVAGLLLALPLAAPMLAGFSVVGAVGFVGSAVNGFALLLGVSQWWAMERHGHTPESLAAAYALEEARVLLREHRIEEAVAALERARREHPDLWRRRGVDVEAFGASARRIRALGLLQAGGAEQVLRLTPGDGPDARALRAAALLVLGRELPEPLEALLGHPEVDESTRASLAWAAFDRTGIRPALAEGRFADARAALERALPMLPEASPARGYYAHLHAWAAIMTLDPGPALRLRPDGSVWNRGLRGEALVVAGRLEEGEAVLLGALAELTLPAHRSVVLGFLALAAAKAGRGELAAERWRSALREDRRSTDLAALARTHPELRDVASAAG